MDEKTQETLKGYFDIAIKIVKGLPELFQPVAFEVVVNILLREDRKEILKEPTGKKPFFITKEKAMKDKIDILAQELHVKDPKSLHTIYEVVKGEIRITINCKERKAHCQRKVAYLYLLAKLMCEQNEWISAIELSKQLKRCKADDGHVVTNLGREKGKILCAGVKKGKRYGLTDAGVEEAKTVLRTLISGK